MTITRIDKMCYHIPPSHPQTRVQAHNLFSSLPNKKLKSLEEFLTDQTIKPWRLHNMLMHLIQSKFQINWYKLKTNKKSSLVVMPKMLLAFSLLTLFLCWKSYLHTPHPPIKFGLRVITPEQCWRLANTYVLIVLSQVVSPLSNAPHIKDI